MSEFPRHCGSQKIPGPTNSAQLDIDPLMNTCIPLWQCYKCGSERGREYVQRNTEKHPWYALYLESLSYSFHLSTPGDKYVPQNM